jgi:uncharacterized protein (DUF433 family)
MAMKHYISSDPAILSGMPVITGTRVPIARILSLLKEGYTLPEIQEQFDHISIETLEGALDEVATIINTAPDQHGKQIL